MNTLPNTFTALVVALEQGQRSNVYCKKLIEDLENYAETNMRLTLVSARGGDVNDVVKLQVSYEKYDEFNKSFESKNYFDRGGQAVLNAREAGYYKVNDVMYLMGESNPNDYFVVLEDRTAKLHDAYQKDKRDNESYVEYLERLVLLHG